MSDECRVCGLCGWVGDDVVSVQETGPNLCMACLAAVKTEVISEKVGKLHPAHLVPIIRACVAQATSAIMTTILISTQTAPEDLNETVRLLSKKLSNLN